MMQEMRDRINAELLFIQWKILENHKLNEDELNKLRMQHGRLNGQLIRDDAEFRIWFETERRYDLVRAAGYATKNHERADHRGTTDFSGLTQEVRGKIDPIIVYTEREKRRALDREQHYTINHHQSRGRSGRSGPLPVGRRKHDTPERN